MTGTEIRWSAERVADEIGLSTSSVYVLLRTGEMRAQKRGRNWLVRPEDVQAWADSQPEHAPLQTT